MELLEQLSEWIRRGHEPPPPRPRAPARWVEQLENRYDIRIPDDFRRYLAEVAGAEDIQDDEMVTWWGLGHIRNIPDELQHPIANPAIAAEADRYLFFADYIFWCWAWAICCSDGPNRGKIAFIGGPHDFVADSFAKFVERYLRDPKEVATTQPRG